MDFKIEDDCYVNDTFIGTAVTKKITVNIQNPNNEFNLENEEISVETGILINNEEELVPFGNFIIQKPTNEETKSKTSFTGYDYMTKFDVAYKDDGVYPISLYNKLLSLCRQVGIELGSTEIVNGDYMILGNPFTNNETCKTVLCSIAQLSGGFAKIGRDNKLYIINLEVPKKVLTVAEVHKMPVFELDKLIVNNLSSAINNIKEGITPDCYKDDFEKNNTWGEVNSLVLRISGTEGENTVQQDEDSIKKNGLTELVIEDNYFLINQAEREKVINPLWNKLKRLKYLPFKTSHYGFPFMDTGDIIYVQDLQGNKYISYIFNYAFTYNGTFSGTFETKALTKTQTALKNTINIKTKFRNAERKIDKINGEIEDIIEEQTDFSNKLTRVNQDIDGITEEVHRLYDFYKEVEGKNEIILEDCLQTSIVELKIKPNTVKNIIYPQSTLYPSNNIYPHKAGDGVTVVFGARTRVVSEDMIFPGEAQYPSTNLLPIGDSSTKKFQFYFKEPLRTFNNTCDELQIIFNEETGICEAKVLRRIDYNNGIYTIYETPQEEFIKEITMELFKGINYVYLEEYTDWNIYAKYIFNNELNKEFAPRVESRSEVRKTADEINLEVSKKVNQNEVIASINLSPEQIKILAKNLQLEGFTSINGNFTIDEEGNMICNNATIKGAVIANGENFSVDEEGNVTCKSATMENVTCENFTIKNSTIQEGYIELKSTNGNSSFSVTDTSTDRLNSELSANTLNFNSNLDRGVAQIGVDMASGNGFLSVTGIAECASLIQTSKQEKKKYIKKINKKAIDLINNSDICQYQLKGEKATGHRHYGLVIGENYNCPDEVVAENGKGVEIYSMIALAWKAIQELSEENKKLREKLEGGI